MVEPFEAVTKSKQRQIIKVTNRYIQENDVVLEVRFDVVSIVKNQYQTKIDHIESAFYPIEVGFRRLTSKFYNTQQLPTKLSNSRIIL